MAKRVRVSWRDNRGNALVSVAAQRAAAAGIPVLRTQGGDFLLEGGPDLKAALVNLGLVVDAAEFADIDVAPLHPVRAAVLAGAGGAYPYYAYYVHAGLSLGLIVHVLEPKDVVNGALYDFDILFLPGGFAIWGLDRSEDVAGLDNAVRDFLARGGGIIASCGGAFYLSAGRPEWLEVVDARPRHTHEYLQTGAAIVDVEISDPILRAGLPERMEIPYYHGPAYVSPGSNGIALGHFRDVVLPSRLFIDNPLKRENFERSLENRPAILTGDGSTGRAILFSPHPEMGDLVRKYIALDGYVREYLPIRGSKTMDETLRHYDPSNSPSFRLILNAIASLDLRAPVAARARTHTSGRAPSFQLDSLGKALQEAIERISDCVRVEERCEFARLVDAELDRLQRMRLELFSEWFCDQVRMPTCALESEIIKLAAAAATFIETAPRAQPVAAAMIAVELPLRIIEAALKIRRCDAAFAAI